MASAPWCDTYSWTTCYILSALNNGRRHLGSPSRTHTEHSGRVRVQAEIPTRSRGHSQSALGAERAASDVPTFTGMVQVPFSFYDKRQLAYQVDLFDGDALVWEIATGQNAPPPPRPHDPLTAWVALAYMGGIEANGPILPADLDREQRLRVASKILDEEELLVVETIAVPQRYRKLSAQMLEDMVYLSEDYRDRMWAGCWLILTGWTAKSSCSLREVSDKYPVGKLEHAVLDAYARSLGVEDQNDIFGCERVGGDYESNLILHRFAICEVHYKLNGPPPYEYMSNTVPIEKGWRSVVHLVPEDID